MSEIVTIETLGHRGDGIVATAAGALYVPFALPGERVSIERVSSGGDGARARIVEVLEPSPERVSPICQHFGRCGGCALQMLPLERTRTLKRKFVVAALAQRGLTPDVAETVGVPAAGRRRAVLTAVRIGGRVMLGYHERLSHALVDIGECPVLAPPLEEALPSIRALVAPLLHAKKPARVTVLLTGQGLDIDLDGVPTPGAKAIGALADAAPRYRLARLSINSEPVLSLAEPALMISGVPLVPPPSAFVQASAEAEATMAVLVADHLGGAKRIADLFAGVGTFALTLAKHAPVHAVEVNAAALEALARATRRAAGLKPIKTEVRDLFADPLSPKELSAFDGVVFDPPRAGAKAQTESLASSKVARVAAVSCNPATFARDARILVDGGYGIERIVPVDQFVYSAETEVVGLFRRD